MTQPQSSSEGAASAPAVTAPPRPRLRDAAAALHHRDFALFWTGAVLSNTGSWVQRTAVPFVLFEMTGSATWVGFSAFVGLIPAVVMGPLAGSIADRYPRRLVLLVSQSVMAVLAVGLWLVFAAGAESPGVIVVFAAATGIVGGLNIASWQAFVSELVPPETLLNAVTLNSAQFNASSAFGPALAGVILAAWGPSAAFLVNAVSFGFVITALVFIRGARRQAAAAGSGRVLAEFAETARYVRARPGMAVCVKVVVLLGLLGSPVFQLVKVFTDEVFKVGPVAFGFMGASLGIGSVIGTPFVAGPGSGLARGRLTFAGVVAYGSALAAFALAPGYAVGLAALFIAGVAYLPMASALNTTLQLLVEEQRRGKVLALYLMSFTASIPIGALVQGWLADVVGPRPTVAVAGCLFAASGLWLGPVRGLLWRMDDPRPA
ncbi:MAG: MFS transporter [Actinobacteria bacterium]|nr:MFS transporter [Actinomycetota bacterium]